MEQLTPQQEIRQLREQLQKSIDMEAFVVKEGTIVILNEPEWPSEKFGKIAVGIDASAMFMGKMFSDFMSFDVPSREKELFAQFSDGHYGIGDRIKVMCAVGSYQMTKKKGTDIYVIYNNVTLVKCRLIEKASAKPAPSAEPDPATDWLNDPPITQEEAPF